MVVAQGPTTYPPIPTFQDRSSVERSENVVTTGTGTDGQLGEGFHLEIVEAHDAGFDIEEYMRLRDGTISHAEALETLDKNVYSRRYLMLRKADFSHCDAVILGQAAFDEEELESFRQCIAHGITHDQLVYLAERAPSFSATCIDLMTGVQFSELVEAWDLGFSLWDYGWARDSGVTHEEMVDLGQIGGWAEWYIRARLHGWGHIVAAECSVGAGELWNRDEGVSFPEFLPGPPVW